MPAAVRDTDASSESTIHGIEPSTLRTAGWAVVVSLVGVLLAWTFGILFLTAGGIYAPLSDLGSLLYNLPLVVVAWALYRVYRPTAPAVSGVVLVVGILGVSLSSSLESD